MQLPWWRLRSARRKLAGRFPRAILAAAAASSHAGCRLRLTDPSPELVREVFEDASSFCAPQLAAEIAASHSRNKVLGWIAATRGLPSVLGMLSPASRLSEALAEHPRVILLTFHTGPLIAVAAALLSDRHRTLLIKRQKTYAVPAAWEVCATQDAGSQAAGALLRSVLWLRSAGVVVIAADGGPSSSKIFGLPCLGRSIRLSRGPFYLARKTAVPVIPAVGSWAPGGVMRVEVGRPLELEEGSAEVVEEDLARQAAAWLERRLLEHPGEISIPLLRGLAAAPRLASPGFWAAARHFGQRHKIAPASSNVPVLSDSRSAS